jgi:hypothetical protein
MIRFEDAELHQADRGADRAGGDDDVDDRERAPAREQAVRQPQHAGHRQQRLGGKNRERQRRGKGQQRVIRRPFDPVRTVGRADERHYARGFIARSAAERTSSGLNVVRHRKSPGSHIR